MATQILIPLIVLIACGDPELHTFEDRTPGGVLTERYTYYLKNGEEINHGDSVLYFNDGRPMNIMEYSHGKQHGKVTLFYKRIERKEVEYGYKNDVLEGMTRWWSPKGELLFECEYRDNKPWQGRRSTSKLSSIGTASESAAFETIEYRQGKRVAGSEKTIKVKYQTMYRDDLPDVRTYLRWLHRRYETKSDYPYLEELPSYDKVPFLIDWCANKGSSSRVAHSQLTALTRVDFGGMSRTDEGERMKEIQAWKRWWKATGKDRHSNDKTPGVVDRAAWRLIARNRKLEVPTKPIVIPNEYTIEWNFRSGDYFGIHKENLKLTRTLNDASLVRTYSTETGGKERTEEWHGFDIALADRTARALGYLIDNPWLLNNDKEINRRFWKERDERKDSGQSLSFPNRNIAGRESYGLYYPSVSFIMNDGAGNVWWNEDPWSWHSPNPMHYNSSAQPLLSSTYPFVTEQFPETKRFTKATETGWKEIDTK